MKSLIKILFSFLCLAFFQNVLAQEAYYLKQEVTHKIVSEGNSTEQDNFIEEFYFNNHFLVFVSTELPARSLYLIYQYQVSL